MGCPASDTSGFPGNLVDPYLAGITITTLLDCNLAPIFLLATQHCPGAGSTWSPPYLKTGLYLEPAVLKDRALLGARRPCFERHANTPQFPPHSSGESPISRRTFL